MRISCTSTNTIAEVKNSRLVIICSLASSKLLLIEMTPGVLSLITSRNHTFKKIIVVFSFARLLLYSMLPFSRSLAKHNTKTLKIDFINIYRYDSRRPFPHTSRNNTFKKIIGYSTSPVTIKCIIV